jgi:BCD family chlorophyll transporter-like MFS transporter
MVFALGLANGLFAVSALGLMMSFAGGTGGSREGMRVGVWGAAQAAAFGFGGFAGAGVLDLMRHWLGTGALCFAIVFIAEAVCFLAAAAIALRLERLVGARIHAEKMGPALAQMAEGTPT